MAVIFSQNPKYNKDTFYNMDGIKNRIVTIHFLSGKLACLISESLLDDKAKETYLHRLKKLPEDIIFCDFVQLVHDVLSPTDLKYIFFFYIMMSAEEISVVFNIDPHSVYTARYRIRKKVRNIYGCDLII